MKFFLNSIHQILIIQIGKEDLHTFQKKKQGRFINSFNINKII